MAAKDDYAIDTLLDMGLVSQAQLAQAREHAALHESGVVDALVALKVITPDDVTQARAMAFGHEMVNLLDNRISDDVIAMVSRQIARRYKVVPVFANPGSIAIALSDPADLDTIDSLHHLLKTEVEIRVASEAQIQTALDRYYGADDDTVGQFVREVAEGGIDLAAVKVGGEFGDDGAENEDDAPLIKLVNTIIGDAFKQRASDIHIEPLERKLRIRYRVDGVLIEANSPPKRLQAAMISRLKIQSGMSIAERRIPQDGRIQLEVGNKPIDLRVSCIPTGHGESIVMRILDKTGLKLGLSELGFLTDDQQTFEKLIGLPDGIILVTGPTGSGKTTTLYSCLNYINRPDRKIITVEDPVEYVLAGINQVQVHEVVGLTFAAALRAMLRQAPNVVMLGEIRDLETATIAINASLTGHLVFSTLHTNDAPGAVTRLVDLGVKPFLVASSTRALMAQRLVRKICRRCAAPHTPSESELRILGIDPKNLAGATPMKGRGCNECNKGGYRGRFGIFEIFVMDDEARKLIYDQADNVVLRARARQMGMRTLREDGARKVLAGLTSAEEVIRATTGDAE
ncbi:MAG: Flp pilus assembly complex ATPase component TadA [Verrucomicrobia bacterium]|nr:Flp pilus assembly complex ATPase component TadA [Verrucomicrobiota bacterium]